MLIGDAHEYTKAGKTTRSSCSAVPAETARKWSAQRNAEGMLIKWVCTNGAAAVVWFEGGVEVSAPRFA